MFNLRHSSLRNAIERIFGVLKTRFPVLTHQLAYSYPIQVQLVQVLCCLHNIIRIIGGDDDIDDDWNRRYQDEYENNTGNSVGHVSSRAITTAQVNQAKAMRDDIANRMWIQYARYKDTI